MARRQAPRPGERWTVWLDIKLANKAGPRTAFLPILDVPGWREPREERSIMMTNQGSKTVLDSLLAKTHVQHALVQLDGRHNELPSVSASHHGIIRPRTNTTRRWLLCSSSVGPRMASSGHMTR